MFRISIFLPSLLAGLMSTAAMASTTQGELDGRSIAPRVAEGIRLAQQGDVEVYFDGDGNRIIVDAYTGEVIAKEPPRRKLTREGVRRYLRARELQRRDAYLDDPAYEPPLRRRGDYDPRFDENLGPVDQYDPYAQGDLGVDSFPEAPRDGYLDQGEEPGIVREPVRRQPLPDAGSIDGEEQASIAPETGNEIINAEPPAPLVPPPGLGGREDVAAVQVLMDRAGASPGVIDGKFGSNVDKAFAAYREITGTNLKSTDSAGIKAALAASGGEPFIEYTITPEDAAGPFVASIPADYSQKAQLPGMSYTSVTEALAERFHMDETYLKALNPEANFSRPGTVIKVANTGSLVTTKVARIVANKGLKQVFAFDQGGKLVAAYPATIGSSDTPSPTGTHAVSRIAFNPNYTYNPKINFKQGDNDKVLTIPPGPNGPVGSIWIALDKPTYGIHGTPDPSKIGKTESHGCVRLTNWDAQELAKLVSPGVIVQFID
jgi:lipoprotein-anchoring transpeptidase ErfK/SrfK